MIHKFSPIERLLLGFNVIPHPLLDTLSLVIAGRTVTVAVKMGLFDKLSKKARTVEQLSKELKASEQGVSVMLGALEALNYVKVEKGNKYVLTKSARKFLVTDSEKGFKNLVLFGDYVFSALNNLEENIRRGGPKKIILDEFGSEGWDIFNSAMSEVATANVSEILKKVPFNKDHRKLLDIGGSHGIHAIESCKKWPNLKATVMDLEPTKKQAEKIIKESGLAGRVKFKTGNFLKAKLSGGNDIVFAINVIHGLNPQQNRDLMKKVSAALNTGGYFIIVDQITDAKGSTQLSKLVASTMGVMLFNQAGGKTYSFDEVSTFMAQAGLGKLQMKKLRDPGSALIVGQKRP